MIVKDRIHEKADALTASERKVASVVLADYPFAGLETIQELAERTRVSAPSIMRFVNKIGCNGYQEFQRQLIGELKAGHRSPVELKLTEDIAQSGRFLADYADRIAQNAQEVGSSVSQAQFDAVCDLIADPQRNIFLLGGRVSDCLAQMLSIHLKQIRGRIHHLPSNPELWPDYVLRMRKQDVVVLFDFRRYQKSLAELAEVIHETRQSTIIVVTDKWLSPIAAHSSQILALPIEIGTAWDTLVSTAVVIEAIIVRVSARDWEATRNRIQAWDALRLEPPDGMNERTDLEGKRKT